MKESAVKERILDVASRLFYEQGYNLTGINQIIEEADIARASLYHHFKSKDDLLMSYLKEAEAKWFVDLEAHLRPIKDPRKKLISLVDYRIALQLRSDFSGCRFVKLSAEVSRDQKKVFDFLSAHKKKFYAIIKSLVEQLPLPASQSAELVAETIFLLIEGATSIGSLQKDELHLRQAKKIITNMI